MALTAQVSVPVVFPSFCEVLKSLTESIRLRVYSVWWETIPASRDNKLDLGVTAFETCLRRIGPDFLSPRDLANVAVVATCARKTLCEACDLWFDRESPPYLELLASRSVATRSLHRARLLQSLRDTRAAACLGLGCARMLLIIKPNGCALANKQVSLEPSNWVCVAPERGADASTDHYNIVSVSVSPWFVLAIEEHGGVLRAVFSPECKFLNWEEVDGLKGVEAASVHCRFGQNYVVTRAGEVYAWGFASGDGTAARLCSMGFPEETRDTLKPTKITNIPSSCGFGRTPIFSVACGAVHAVFLSSYGEAFAVGQGHEGQLGHKELGDTVLPVRMALPESVRVRAAACGLQHTVLVSVDGEAWGCGCTASGALPIRRPSLGVLPPELVARGMKCWAFEAVPRRLDLLPSADDFFVISTAAGFGTSYFLGDDGRVLFTGTPPDDPSPFGRSHGAEPYIPYQIPMLPPIRHVAVSLDVPLQINGISVLVRTPTVQTSEVALFSAVEEGRYFEWCCPGESTPTELNL
eukprot:TRINITY_DN29420_c0_g1_i1.p1 TRINITY_DN29420_c0_g1~~TRINITY_DN29420_c0_g1_i1.p1  ORF type:complete len:524 (+),score=33.67 TRINITY_DN29420_c0_g1_i1:52-1623(+)